MRNITLDFSSKTALQSLTEGEELAVMPASLAKKLLTTYAAQLSRVTLGQIIDEHVKNLHNAYTMNEVMNVSIEFVRERELIQNITHEMWDAYKVEGA